jgi:hypothetical protein
MPELQGDDRLPDADLQQVHYRRVPEYVRRDALAPESARGWMRRAWCRTKPMMSLAQMAPRSTLSLPKQWMRKSRVTVR